MRTTITLDSDAEVVVRRLMRERRLTFKQAVNAAILSGASPQPSRFKQRTFDMGAPMISIEHAERLAAALEDEGIVRKLALGK